MLDGVVLDNFNDICFAASAVLSERFSIGVANANDQRFRRLADAASDTSRELSLSL